MDARRNCASLQGLTALSHLIGTRPSRPSVTDDIAEGVTILKPGGRGDCRGDKQERTVRMKLGAGAEQIPTPGEKSCCGALPLTF